MEQPDFLLCVRALRPRGGGSGLDWGERHSGRKDALAHRHVRPITGIIGRVGRLRGGYALPTLGRSGKLSWCSNGLTGAEVQGRLAWAPGGHFLRPTRATTCWTGRSLQYVWTLLGLPRLFAERRSMALS